MGGEHRRRIGGQADKGLLAEGHQADHAGQQHQAQAHQRREADVVEQGHVEIGNVQRRRRDEREEREQRGACAHGSSSSTWCRLASERHTSTGMMMVKTMTSLNALAQNEENDSSSPSATAPSAAAG